MKRLLIISGNTNSIVWFRLDLLKEFIREGFEVYALAPESNNEAEKELKSYGINYIKIGLERKSFNVINLIKGISDIKQNIDKLSPEIVISYMHKSVIASSLAVALSRKNIRVFSIISGLGHLFERSDFKHGMLRFLSSFLLKLSFKFNNKVFFQNPDDRNFFEHSNLLNSEKAILVNGSGVNTKKFSYSEIPHKTVFMTMARLLESKGLREFAESAKVVKERFPETRFIIYGYPDEHSDSISEKEIIDLWPDKYGTEYLGYTEKPSTAYDAASVFVLLSYREGIPRTVLEAMAKSRPIIATDVPGCRETVIDGLNGYLVPPKR